MRIFNKIFIFLTENYNISIQSLTMINPSRKIYNIYYSSRRHPFHPLRFKNTSISMNIEKYIYIRGRVISIFIRSVANEFDEVWVQ